LFTTYIYSQPHPFNHGQIYRQETSFSFKLVYQNFYLLRQTSLKLV